MMAPSVSASRRASSGSGKVPGNTVSTSVWRTNGWATIAVAALSGSLLYGLVALAERRTTFWHPSFRGRHD